MFSVLATVKDNETYELYMEDGLAPYWDYYVDAYEYARVKNIKGLTAIDFYSMEQAISLHGDIFTHGGVGHVGSHQATRTAYHCGRQDHHLCCLV